MVTMSPGMTPPLPLVFLLMILAESVDPSVTSSSLHQHTGKTLVSISPSGEIVEGSTVNLICNSDVNSPEEKYFWFKTDGHYEGPKKQTSMTRITNKTTRVYTISNVRANDSGGYRCLPQNSALESDIVVLNVLYQPWDVSVSISPSGEIVEGSSVTLTCSSDANPPVKIYNWFKKSKEIAGKGQNVYIPKIHSEDRGEYKCISTNKYGSDQSPAVCLDVLYPPKSVSVSISQIVEGISVTLTCSSDANPPVKNYTWFEEGGSSPVGSGNTYSIINITMEDKRRFYCKAQNKIGSQTSSAVSVLEPRHFNTLMYALTGLAVCGGFFLLVTLWICFRFKQREGFNKQDINSHDQLRDIAADPSNDSDADNQDDVLYTTVSLQASLNVSPGQPSVSSTEKHTQYASIKFHQDTDGTKKSGNDHAPCSQLGAGDAEDPSVIYSSVKKHK